MSLNSGMSINWSGKHYVDPCTKLYPYAEPGGSSQNLQTTTHCPDDSAERDKQWKAYQKKIWEAQCKRDEERSKTIEALCEKNRKEERRIECLPPIESY